MKGSLLLFTSVVAFVAFASYSDVLSAQGRGAGAGARRGAPATPAKPPAAGRAAPTRPTPLAPQADAARGRGERGRPEAAGRGRGDGAEQVPAWARERRPPTAPELVAHNPQLAARLQTLLPGSDLQTASAGFSNLGSFVAAVHVSDNLGIPFDQLKTRIVGQGMNLGEAIQALRPDTDPKAAAARAEGQARADLADVRDN